MDKFLNKMERKFGRFAIRNLMNYIIGIYIAGAVISMISPYFYYQYLCLNVPAILHGQIWRLVTFILEPIGSAGSFSGIFFLMISLYFYYMIGRNLENTWGAFRFNLYYLSGILMNIIAAFIVYAITKNPASGYYFGIDYINQSMFLAFCVMYPDVQVLLMFIVPIKVKWLGIVYGAMIGFQIVQYVIAGQWYFAVAVLVAVANFLLFWFSTRNYRRVSPRDVRRRNQFKRAVNNAAGYKTSNGIARHRCAVCGRTELDDPNLEFRYCSKCAGSYEYCQDHLFTHQHVTH